MKNPKSKFQISNSKSGFTLMEIIVATTIFAIVVTALFSLFNYTLKINRRTEALRQATQGMRSLVEFIAKEVRNGQIDYAVVNGTSVAGLNPCYAGSSGDIYGQTDTIAKADNRFGIITAEGDRECFYLADAGGSAVIGSFTGKQLMVNKNGIVKSLNPQYFTVDQAKFFVRPTANPYRVPNSPKQQPMLMLSIQFTAQLPTGERVPIYYQTTISSDKYDIPTQ